jgi:hypothetical protein
MNKFVIGLLLAKSVTETEALDLAQGFDMLTQIHSEFWPFLPKNEDSGSTDSFDSDKDKEGEKKDEESEASTSDRMSRKSTKTIEQ